MSVASPAKPHNTAARLGLIFEGVAVVLSVGFTLASFSEALTGTPAFVGEIVGASGVVVLIAAPALCVAGIVFGILGVVRSGRLGEAGIAIVAICVGAVLLIGFGIIVALISFLSTMGPELKG